MRGMSATLIRMLLVVGTLTASLAPSALTAAQGNAVTVGNTTITWQGDWEYDAAASLDEQATFSQIDVNAGVIRLLSYGEFADQTVATADQAIDVFADAFFEGAGLAAVAPRTSGLLPDGSSWRVYDLDLQGTAVSFVISARVNAFGTFTITSLTANTEEIGGSLVMVQSEFALNGSGRMFAGLDPADVTGGANVPSAAAPSSTAQAVTVGSTRVTWEGEWLLETEPPIEDLVSFAFVEPATITYVIYGDFDDIAFLGPEGILNLWIGTMFETFDVMPGPPLASGEVVDGSIWRLYVVEYDGLELQAFGQARSVGDSVVLSMLFTTSDDLDASIALVQEDFTLNGTGQLFETSVIAAATGGTSGSSALVPTVSATERLPMPTVAVSERLPMPTVAATERPPVRADLVLPTLPTVPADDPQATIIALEATIAAQEQELAERDADAPTGSLNPAPVQVTLQVDLSGVLNGDGGAIGAAEQEIRETFQPYIDAGDCRAGFVLLSGRAPDIGQGNQIADEVFDIMVDTVPEVFGETDDYAQSANETVALPNTQPNGEVVMQVFLYAGCSVIRGV